MRSTIEYSDVLLCNASGEILDCLDKVHKRAARIVSGAIRGTHSDVLYNELSWQTLASRREERMLMLYSDIVHGRAPDYLSELLPQTVSMRTGGRYNLRNANDLSREFARKDTFKNSFIPAMTDVWNNTPENIRSIESRPELKAHLRRNRPPCNPFFLLGRRTLNITLARIRMKCSELNEHLYNMHILESPLCQCGEVETSLHYFFHCPYYHTFRLRLQRNFNSLEIDFTLNSILHGDEHQVSMHANMIESIDTFMTATNRFSLLRAEPLS